MHLSSNNSYLLPYFRIFVYILENTEMGTCYFRPYSNILVKCASEVITFESAMENSEGSGKTTYLNAQAYLVLPELSLVTHVIIKYQDLKMIHTVSLSLSTRILR